ncbi:MAG TPA: glycosyltransferase [Ignavibacteria bacterium]
MSDNVSIIDEINDLVRKTEESVKNSENIVNENNKEERPFKHKKFRKRIYGNRQNIEKNLLTNENGDFKKVVLPNQMVSVVIPLYNEEESLMELSLSIKRVFDNLRCGYEVILIDDGSTDKSFEKIKEIHNKNGRFHCIKFRRNRGKSAALSAGFKAAKGDIVITMDADLQDDPKEIPDLIKVINSGYDLVSGWKKVRFDPFIKKHTSKLFNYVTSKVSGIRLHDFNCGLKAYRKEVIKSLKIYGELHRFIPALAHLAGFRVTEKIVKHQARKFGVTKFGANRFFNGFFDLLTVVFTTKFIKKPLHLFGMLGVLSSILGFLIILGLFIVKTFFTYIPLSSTPIFYVGILLIIVGVQFFATGLLAEMITRTSSQDEEDSIIEKSL